MGGRACFSQTQVSLKEGWDGMGWVGELRE